MMRTTRSQHFSYDKLLEGRDPRTAINSTNNLGHQETQIEGCLATMQTRMASTATTASYRSTSKKNAKRKSVSISPAETVKDVHIGLKYT
jgi:hypothetical protein